MRAKSRSEVWSVASATRPIRRGTGRSSSAGAGVTRMGVGSNAVPPQPIRPKRRSSQRSAITEGTLMARKNRPTRVIGSR